MRHAFVPMRTFPGGVSGICEVMRFTLLPCDALRPSDEIRPSEQSEGAGHVLRRSELVKTMVPLLNFWLAWLAL